MALLLFGVFIRLAVLSDLLFVVLTSRNKHTAGLRTAVPCQGGWHGGISLECLLVSVCTMLQLSLACTIKGCGPIMPQ